MLKGDRMKRLRKILVILLFLPFVMGMGSILGDESSDKIPLPEKKYIAIYIDTMDVTTKCTDVSIQGKTFIEGKMGEGTYTIPFDNIKQIVFIVKNDTLTGRITLKDGDKTTVILKRDQKAYGQAKYGTFQIKLNNLKKIVFLNGN